MTQPVTNMLTINVKSGEIKTLNQILHKDDLLTRYHLLQLWTIDIFTQSVPTTDVHQLVEALSTDLTSSSAEAIYSNMNTLKKSIIDINDKLKTVQRHIEQQQFLNNLLERILDITSNDKAEHKAEHKDLSELIKLNEQRIQRLNELSEAKITELLSNQSDH